MKLGFKRGQKGFTLVELMVVMAILGVLAAIIMPAVSGTQEVSTESQVKQDASTANTAMADYYKDRTGAEVVSSNTTSILGTSNNTTQVISSRWAEKFMTVGYANEFPVAAPSAAGNVEAVNLTDLSGNTTTAVNFASGWNALDLSILAGSNYIPAVPKSSTDVSGNYHNFLWIVKKTTASGGASGASRQVQIFKLTKVVTAEATKYNTLYYTQVY